MKTILQRLPGALLLVWVSFFHGSADRVHAAQDQPVPPMQKLANFGTTEYCALIMGANGTLHAAYAAQQGTNHLRYVFYQSSRDIGKTWSEPENLSESGLRMHSGFLRLAEDGQGRVYCFWKYMEGGTDGPGAKRAGRIVYRCLENDRWSAVRAISPPKSPAYSWYLAVDPKGVLHVVWSQLNRDLHDGFDDIMWANQVSQVSVNGAVPGQVKDLITPKPLRIGSQPLNEGIINMNGYIDATGKARFIGEDPGVPAPGKRTSAGRRIILWNGTKRVPLHTYLPGSRDISNWQLDLNPPGLLLDGQGNEFLIRFSEKKERPSIQSYAVSGETLEEPVDIFLSPTINGWIRNWQFAQLPGGRAALTVSFSESRAGDRADLYLCLYDGKGVWTEPRRILDNKARKELKLGPRPSVNFNETTTFAPRFTAVTTGTNGAPLLLVVDVESSRVKNADASGNTLTKEVADPYLIKP